MTTEPLDDTLARTRAFWNASPCGAQDTFEQRVAHRYRLEPWVMDVLRRIAERHAHVLEIGCGQGTDGIVLCTLLAKNGSYLGIDYSDDSVQSAARAMREAQHVSLLNVEPTFRTANAEQLDIPDGSVRCVYSNGVLHHTARPLRAIAEVWRVLEPGGEAFITLYRKPSMKVGIAKALRRLQHAMDAMMHQDRCLYRVLRGRSAPSLLGTMLLEGVGVPVMEWYSQRDISSIFSRFEVLEVAPVGCNIPRSMPRSRGWTRWGYMWFIHLLKPADP